MIIEILTVLFLSLGALFFLIGTIAILRFPDVYCRLHGTTKCDTLGLGLILAGLILYEGATLASVKMVFIIVFVFLTNPVAAHAFARAIYKHGVKLWEKSVVDRYKEQS
ncbi:MAG: monovalent cation/H(+) antiporter subunit G [Dehalococcoidia bacterium]|uniref:Na+/H+ antiporter subunit G n=1 Tax=candidate division NPL-UPA2 bacterium Unc8 TaxID=1980939 RepID=A0A399FVN5_UNCN2|nr:Na(+)/H(+) antiporter subunit G [Chloroflexota bacterium]RII00191.1 MAG: Na+/H+ antiporter subunit G [candidate division NPL-UPA2 bacterium Unc8]